MKRQCAKEIDATSKSKMRQTTLFSTKDLSDSIREELWKTTTSLFVYTHPKCLPSSKILGLDMDGTIIIPSSGKVFPKDYTDWKLINDNVIPKLKEYFEKGYKIVFLSNQRGITKGYQDIHSFKLKIQNIVDKLNLPVQAIFSILDDRNRKPLTGMWEYLENDGNSGILIDSSASLYSGDAAGRLAFGKRKKDHSCCDRLFALNIGIRFLTPEQLWFDQVDTETFEMPKFNPTELLTNGIHENNNSKLPIIHRPTKPELILMVGYPASGKSHFCNQVLIPLGYEVISRDNIGTWQKCVQAVEQATSKSLPVVVDNTNMDVESRARYIKIAKVWDIPVRCFIMETTIEHAQHNERFRSLTNLSHKPISQMVFNMMRSKYEKPTIEEGYQEIVTIPFILDKNMENLSLYCKYLLEK
ncbi:Bifunctional polynucleotide phosphatase/kinase isoform 1 [Schistosoma japonicum]|uniref:Bifunctional polynucleotide phosphatase/kinase isoform 1 n=1 Tax=Schistosoma japonicum TaxID=6182 RepID=A0A4Z2DEJ6_SCHJA|nr:Bifunctional polynucleotide phosphatase/kinase [Schistosoma japonicum]TNN14838.1 Bifunctional polynucleotide phosphatase/kinase isoform 1 [Schistosoma japonicum]